MRYSLLVCVLLCTPGYLRAEDVPADLEADARLLEKMGLASEGEDLLAWLRSHTPTAEDEVRLRRLVGRLGDDEFTIREAASQELTRSGRLAVPLLRPALGSDDPEVDRRARLCIEEIEQTPHTALFSAVARLLAHKRTPGAVEALLACLPWTEEEQAEEAVVKAIVELAVVDGIADPLLVRAASDREPVRRVAAARALCQAAPEQRALVLRLLDDPDPQVRFHAATGLTRAGERDAVPTLIRMLTDASLAQAFLVEDLLCRIAGEPLPVQSPPAWDGSGRKQYRDGWLAWWKQHGAAVDLLRLRRPSPLLGLTLVCELDGSGKGSMGRIWEGGSDGKERWALDGVSRPIDVQVLATGRLLVAEHGEPRVTERDREGNVVWEFRTARQPVSCRRLANGNTFIVTYNQLLEVTPARQVVFSVERQAMIYHGQKLPNGHLVCVQSNNMVVEMDATGKEIHSVPVNGTGGWASVEKLENGSYLVALYSGRKVVEVDASGKVFWEYHVDSPGHATRLPNGRTLIASIEGRKVIEVDRAGNEVWSANTQGRPFHVHRR